MTGKKLCFIGGGNMAEAMVKGLLHEGVVTAEQVVISEPRGERVAFLSSTYKVQVVSDNLAAAKDAAIILLAVKPQMMKTVLQELSSVITTRHLIISIAAGVTISSLVSLLGEDKRIVRAMPNTPAQIAAGAIALCQGAHATQGDLQVAKSFFNCLGTTVIVEESLMDAVTGLSGSGPAYIFMIIEALVDGGVKMGLPRDISRSLVLQTIIGASRMVLETGAHTSTLKDMVTSPGGTTIAGLHVLEGSGIRAALMNAVAAATARSSELAKSLAF